MTVLNRLRSGVRVRISFWLLPDRKFSKNLSHARPVSRRAVRLGRLLSLKISRDPLLSRMWNSYEEVKPCGHTHV
jgi:hypothetical protein